MSKFLCSLICTFILIAVFGGCAAPRKQTPFTKAYYIPAAPANNPSGKLVTITVKSATCETGIIEAGSLWGNEIDGHISSLAVQLEKDVFASYKDKIVDPNVVKTFTADISIHIPSCKLDGGQLAGGSILAGLTLGIASPFLKIDATWNCQAEMVVQRSDGATRKYSENTSSKGKVGNDSAAYGEHTAIRNEAIAQTMINLAEKIKTDSDFWRAG